jgi:proline racemase
MRWRRRVQVVQAHAEGEASRVITGGFDPPPGASMAAKAAWLAANEDGLRRLCLFEPRGAAPLSAVLLVPPCLPDADLGLIVMESVDYPAMSGSNAICAVTVALETGSLPMREPTTELLLDTPAGPVAAVAACADGRCRSVTLSGLDSYVVGLDQPLQVPGIGDLACDIAYGGAFFALVDAGRLGLALVPGEARRLVEIGERITAAARAQHPVAHPALPHVRDISFTHFGGPPDAEGVRRSAVVVQPGRLDRSPCGTGTLAKLAALQARGEIGVGETLVHESPIGTRFRARLEGVDGGLVKASLTGRAWITGLMQVGADPDDPTADGFVLPDTWGPSAR